ncbi:unnamed protein product [Mytilus edulis]|uniref:CCHC-type domain-containing protein n=1 Tax=Mytilus edulis TaxID=6550 RepID=A0A8S3SZF3_MYTED|nr:unnamed protein product [Mytilus edulis]
MPAVKCPVPDCQYETDDLDAVVVAALLTTHATVHSAAAGAIVSAKVEKVKRPTVASAGSSEDWTYFVSRWKDYIQATKVSGKDLVIQLLECCDETLRRDITRSAGGSLVDKSEQEVLAAMRTLAVREENTMVARVSLHGMTQDRDETVRSFGARLRGQASVCKFTLQCTGCEQNVDYTEAILRDVLTRGLSDPDIQLDLLGDKNQDMTLEQVFKFVEAKEAGKRSASRLLDSHGAEAASSSYRRKRNANVAKDTQKYDNNKVDLCGYCGKKGHGKSAPPKIRQKECPAYGHTCKNCERDNHYESVCRSNTSKPKVKQNEESESAVFDSLCAATVSPLGKRTIQLDHHLYSQMHNTWIKRPSQPQPFINIVVKVVEDDYKQLGFQNSLVSQQRSTVIPAMADTGCQSCLAGIKVLYKIGLTKRDLIPVNMQMHAANNKGIVILGAVILRISGKSQDKNELETRQIVYITDSSDKFFLSKEACITLGIISENFPTIGEITGSVTDTSALTNDENRFTTQIDCNCPKRQSPPPTPVKLPFSPTEENVPKLQNFLLEHYKSSTFNTCEHQPLPLMEGPPLKLMIDPKATPVACHTPVPVPLHWQDDVKASLDQDVRLGVIEPVPVGEPVTWCHRMVICSKKNGKSRRTVDFQALNAHAIRETHHTQSPFHQARSVPRGKKKTVFDAWNGYHSVPIREEDRHLTTFITPWGRYRYKTAPQGYIASGDGYTRRFDEIVADVPHKTKCVDDTLLWSDDIEESFVQACHWLELCGKHGITLNPEKFHFAQDTVEFAGFEITNDSVRPCKRYLQAILDFPTPKNITDVRSWFGLVNQVSYAFSMADRLKPFRQLIKPGTPFRWDNQLETLFQETKTVIVSEIEEGVRIFDKSKPTCLVELYSSLFIVQHTHAPGPVTAAKVEKVKRPVISTAGTSEEWAYFESRWSDYVEATKIAGRDKVVQLLECCDEQLRKDLTRSAGGSLTNKPVQEVLAAIKKLAVREENTMVARVTLHNMRQDRDEPVRSFCARLRGQAGVCKFFIQCPTCNTDVNYTDTIIRDVLARGISDPEIQLDLLGDKNQDMTLEEVTQFVEAKDSGKRSASRLLDSQTVQAASSSYKKAKQTAVRDKNEVCTYCGKKGHGKSAPARLRKSDCPAYGHKCGYCNREHHFEKVCRSKEKSKTGTATHNTDDCEGAVFDSLCSISSDSYKINGRTLAIDHHLYDNLSDTWISKASQPQPFVNLVLRILPEDYEAFGFNMTKRTNTVAISAMADTGCQSCLAGIKVIHRLGINQTELIPVNMKMHAANNKGITILGATILRISGRDDQGRHVETRQMTYVTDNSDKLFISREACIALRMISDSFPTIGEIDDTQQTLGTENSHNITNNIGSVNSLDTTCNCPQRKLPPPNAKELTLSSN